jgi:hypothetical protein
MRRGRLAPAVCSLPGCSEIFTRFVSDLARTPTPYCSRDCRDIAARVGRGYGEVVCWGCQAPFRKLLAEVKRSTRNFCGHACYQRSIDFSVLGHLGGLAPKVVAPWKKFRRAQLGGLARTRNQGQEGLRAIALKAVASRLANRATTAVKRRAGSTVVFGVRLGRRAA